MPKSKVKKVYTGCDICMVKCGMVVHVKDEKAVFIEGNPHDPDTKGQLCPKAVSALGFLNHPSRLLYPMKRTNPKKGLDIDPKWERITWEEAIETIADKILEATDYGKKGEHLVFFSHGSDGWVTRMAESLGCPNQATHYDTCYTPFFVSRYATIGGNMWCNMESAKYYLSFGYDQLERAKNWPTRQILDAKANGAKIVTFNPFQGQLGAKADEWIPIKPGSDPAVALAMINIIISKNRYDKEFIEKKTNFKEHEKEMREHFAQFTPEWAEKISEVPARDIERIAMEFSDPKNWPALIPNHKRDGGGGPNYANSHVMAQAMLILNVLVGAVDREGGNASHVFGWSPKGKLEYVQNPEKTLTELIFQKGSIDGKHKFPAIAEMMPAKGLMSHAIDRIINKDPFPAKVALIRRYGLQSFPQPDKLERALKTLDFVVWSDTLPKDIMKLADIVLPEPTFLERSYISTRSLPTPGKNLIMSGNAVQKPAGDTKGWTGALIDIFLKIDEKRGTKYFWIKDGDKERPVKSMDDNNARLASVGMTFDELKKAKNGIVEIDAPYKPRSEYKTPSKKLEIYATKLKDYGYSPLPYWVEKAEKPTNQYPYYLIVRRNAAMKNTGPLTCDNEYALDAFPDNGALMNADTAAKLGIKAGDWVTVQSPYGRIQIPAKLTQRIRKDCIMVDHNFGHKTKDLKFSGKYFNDSELIPLRPEKPLHGNEWSGNAYMSDVCVNVRKA